MEIVTLLMTSRSGSSMVADIFYRHGFQWARNERQNPLVGGKVRYHSFENQVIKAFNKQHFGVPLGPLVTYDDQLLRGFCDLVRMEYGGFEHAMWKGAVEFWPLWQGLASSTVAVNVMPCIIWRPMSAVMDSLRAKRQGRIDEKALVEITEARYETLGMLATEYAMPVIETADLIAGDYSSLQAAFEHYGYEMDEDIVRATIKPQKWEADR